MTALPAMIDVDSSHLAAIGWRGNELFVRFKQGGHTYVYSDVPEKVFHAGLSARSPGGWFNKAVRGQFKHRQADAKPRDGG